VNHGMLRGKVALITGGAGAIGRAIGGGFAAEGATVCLLDRDADRLAETCADLAERHGDENILALVADVRDSARVKECVQQVVEAHQTIDILVNNAAVTRVVKIDECEDEHIDGIIDTNLKGYFYCAREAVGVMKRNGTRGVILIISSKNGLFGAAEKSLYSATKGGVLTMARSLARELGQFGIRVNSICPDAVHEGSALWERGGHYSRAVAERYGIAEDDIPLYYRERCALKVNMEPADVANAALFLCSDMSAKITGAILPVDGGVAYVR